jgi:hypothetical protein
VRSPRIISQDDTSDAHAMLWSLFRFDFIGFPINVLVSNSTLLNQPYASTLDETPPKQSSHRCSVDSSGIS